MYLNKKTYTHNSYEEDENKHYKVIEPEGKNTIKNERLTSIEERLMYWRKVNCIHRFFLDQTGSDHDKATIYLELEHLKELYHRIEQILENHSLAEELLPTQEGFFFGSTEYDEYYFKDLEDTLEPLGEIIQELNQNDEILYDLVYIASW